MILGTARRLDWGFENPNKTAALLAVLLAGAWVFPALAPESRPKTKEFLWWVSLAVSAFFGWCLLRTGSRGGAVAAVAGLGAVVLLTRKTAPWEKRKIAAALALFLTAVAAAFLLPQTARFSPEKSFQDDSVWNRWLMWKNIPAMMVATPDGWGLGNAGKAFMEWYQPPERGEAYRTLVNSHGTWLVEFGWLGRIAYITAWASAFRLAWPDKNTGLPAASFGALLAFFTAAVFSSVAEAWPLWILPCAVLFVSLFLRWKNRCFPGWKNLLLWTIPPAAAVCAVILLIGMQASPRLHVKDCGKTVRIGAGNSRLVFAAGENTRESPRDLRSAKAYPSKLSGATWTRLPRGKFIPAQSALVVFGEWETEKLMPLLERAEKIIFFSPRRPPDDFTETVLKKTRVIFGEFSADSPDALAWREKCPCDIVPGMADFINNWPDFLLEKEQL
jgi:hypothetical protein